MAASIATPNKKTAADDASPKRPVAAGDAEDAAPKKKAKTSEQLFPPSNQDETENGAAPSSLLLRRSGHIDSDALLNEAIGAQDAAADEHARSDDAANKNELDASVVEEGVAVEIATAEAGVAAALETSHTKDFISTSMSLSGTGCTPTVQSGC